MEEIKEVKLSKIEEIKILKIPSYYSDMKNLKRDGIQLNISTDTNPSAYDLLAYLRFRMNGDNFKTIFVFAKLCAVPLKKLTLPSLALMGALVSSKVAKYLKNILHV